MIDLQLPMAHQTSKVPRAARPYPEVVQCLAADVLWRILDPDVGGAVWRRPASGDLARRLRPMLASRSFESVSEGLPDEAAANLATAYPGAAPIFDDVRALARLFASLSGSSTVRIRFELVVNDACACFHVDNVALRLLCTYAGLGTELQDRDGRIHALEPGAVAVLKGLRFPDRAPRIPHRSPPVEHLQPRLRPRLLLVIDQPGVF